ncbi:major facilitator transporter, partial [mine drainage metagenome]
KQSAVPLAFLLGGLAVPVIALTVGWRWAFALAAVAAVGAAFWLPRPRMSLAAQRAVTRLRPEPTAPLVALAIAFCLAAGASASLGAFLVLSAVSTGFSSAAAGLVAVLASACGIAVRVLVGLLADRRGGRHFLLVAGMISVGALGFAALAWGSLLHAPVLFIFGAVVAFGIGWGWNGLFNYALVQNHPNAPARATGITQTGGRLGSVIGPLICGVLVEHVGYTGAWAVSAGEALLGAGTLLLGRHM